MQAILDGNEAEVNQLILDEHKLLLFDFETEVSRFVQRYDAKQDPPSNNEKIRQEIGRILERFKTEHPIYAFFEICQWRLALYQVQDQVRLMTRFTNVSENEKDLKLKTLHQMKESLLQNPYLTSLGKRKAIFEKGKEALQGMLHSPIINKLGPFWRRLQQNYKTKSTAFYANLAY